MIRVKGIRLLAAAVVIALLGAGFYLVARTGSSTTAPVTAPSGNRFVSHRSGSQGMYLTPVGTVNFHWKTSETSLIYSPIVPLSAAMNLSKDQRTRILAVQQQTQQKLQEQQQSAEKMMEALFLEIRQTQQNTGYQLPFSDPLSRQVNGFLQRAAQPRKQQRMRDLFGQLVKVTHEIPKRQQETEKTGVREMEAALSDSQKAALPRLLADMALFRTLDLRPEERYTALNLSEDQRYRMAVLAQRVKNQQAQEQNVMAAQMSSRMQRPIHQRQGRPRQRLADFYRQFKNQQNAIIEARRKARREALSVLTPAQRQAVQRPAAR